MRLAHRTLGRVETKELLAVFNRINVASFEQFHKESINDKVQFESPLLKHGPRK